MPLTLYGAPLSPYVVAARWALAEKDVDYEFAPIGPADLRAPDYGLRHPFRKLPSLDVDGMTLFETSAIMRYIDEAFDGPALQPNDPWARAQGEQWMSAANSYLYPVVFTGLVFQRAVAPQFELPVNEELVADSVSTTRGYLDIVSKALESGTLGAQAFVTLGDLFVAAILAPLNEIDEGRQLLSSAPRVANWLTKLSARPSFAAAGGNA
ncbi:MAG: glutathione S-transferase family protein [Pseudomonadota bacterium]